MGSATRMDDGFGPTIPARIRKTILSIREIVGNHSDSEIYVALKECAMDPNEAAQKLLDQDTFHEVRRRRDKKKENLNFNNESSEPAKYPGDATHWTKSQPTFHNTRRVHTRNSTAGVSHEFRVVRDNRVNHNANGSAEKNSFHPAVSSIIQTTSSISEKRKSRPERYVTNGHRTSDSEGPYSTGTRGQPLSEAKGTTGSCEKGVHDNEVCYTNVPSSTSDFGVCSSSADPVHVPSLDSKVTGTVGAIRREVGVRRPISDLPTSKSLLANDSSSSFPSNGHEDMITTDSLKSFGEEPISSKASQFNQSPESENALSGTSVGRPSSNQFGARVHQQPQGLQKATQSHVEWKPKLSQKPSISTSGDKCIVTNPSLSYSSSSTGPTLEVTCLSDRLSSVTFYENEHVIIPQHLRVPEEERAHLTFGSFEMGFDSPKDFASAIQEFTDLKDSTNELILSTSASVSVEQTKVVSSGNSIYSSNSTDEQTRSSQPDSLTSNLEPEKNSSHNTDPSRVQNVEDQKINLLHIHSPSHSPQQQQLEAPSNLPTFSESCNAEDNYDMPLSRTTVNNTVQQELVSLPELLTSAPAAHLYTQMQLPHFVNYLPYRHFVPPMYVPPMAVPNYSSNPPYPPSGSNYVLMPGGSTQVNAVGLNYGVSQYKPVSTTSTTGYGNYTNSTGYPISGPGTVGAATNMEDVARLKYKDGNVFVPNPQSESADVWAQVPREIPGMQPASYFNLPAQVQHAAYLPSLGSHASFGPNQSSHMYQSLYQNQQVAALASQHHSVHQQMPQSIGGNIGMATPSSQIGHYQQPHVGHPQWNTNF